MTPSLPLLKAAFWESPRRGLIFFEHDYPAESWPEIYWGLTGERLTALVRVPPLMMAEGQNYIIEGDAVVFLLWKRDYPYVDPHTSRVYLAGPFNQWGADRSSIWEFESIILSSEGVWRCSVGKEKIFVDGALVVEFKAVTADAVWLSPKPEAWNRVRDAEGNVNGVCDVRISGRQGFSFMAPGGYVDLQPAWIECAGVSRSICVDRVLLSMESQLELGAHVKNGRTCFRLFAPRALAVEVCYGETMDCNHQRALYTVGNGVWEVVVEGDLSQHYYGYRVSGAVDVTLDFDSRRLIADPYATLIVGEQGLGVIEPEALKASIETCYCPPPWHHLMICELHVRDALAQAPIDLTPEERLGFAGLAKWIACEGAYLKSLGVNAIELQPIQAFDGSLKDYHWGYMPINYFSPAPAYALNPDSGNQIEGFRSVVKASHDAGLAVILDVVYNHMGVGNPLHFIDKNYYFRLGDKGQMDNVSGCGNDLRVETPMGRRLMIDSLIHWIQAYDVDGFRFDLAELIGVDVLKDVEVALKKVKPGIILIAEPWSFKGHIGLDLKSTGWSYWNDHFREFIPKYVLGQGNVAGLSYFMQGSTAHLTRFPSQSVHYVESHDDRTWIDKITENPDHDGRCPTVNDVRRTHLMIAITMASLGIPLWSAGQDFIRSKGGLNNTYQQGDINALNYDALEAHAGTARYFREWAAFRASSLGRHYFCHDQTPKPGYFYVFEGTGHSAMGLLYNANGSMGRGRLLFVINPHLFDVDLGLSGLDPLAYMLLADHERVDFKGLKPSFFRWQKGFLHLPPLACAVFLSM